MQKQGTIFLTSTGFSRPGIYNEFLRLASEHIDKKVAIITTASEDKENNQYSQSALSQFLSMGFSKVDFCDLEDNPDQDYSEYDIIYVCGGNTFKLLKYANLANFKSSVTDLLKRGGIYIGVSAGSLILCPSIKIANEINPDVNDVGLRNPDAFSIVDFVVLPHYSAELEPEVINFERKENVRVERLTNDQAIIIKGDSAIKI